MLGYGGPIQVEDIVVVGGRDEEDIFEDGSDEETESEELGGGRMGLGSMGFDEEEEEEDLQQLVRWKRLDMPPLATGHVSSL